MAEHYNLFDKEEEEILYRPTSELGSYFKLLRTIDKWQRLLMSGVVYMSPRVRLFIQKAIEIKENWKFFRRQLGCNKNDVECIKKVAELTWNNMGVDPDRQVGILTKAAGLIEYLYWTSFTNQNAHWLGIHWYVTQGKVDVKYILQPWLGRKRMQILPTGISKGEEE